MKSKLICLKEMMIINLLFKSQLVVIKWISLILKINKAIVKHNWLIKMKSNFFLIYWMILNWHLNNNHIHKTIVITTIMTMKKPKMTIFLVYHYQTKTTIVLLLLTWIQLKQWVLLQQQHVSLKKENVKEQKVCLATSMLNKVWHHQPIKM